jgi:hypothetical protein
MLRTDLVPGALMHLSNLPLQLDGLAIVLGEGKQRGSGYNILFRGEVVNFHVASTPAKLVLSARVNPQQPKIYYTFKPILLAGAPHDRQQRQDHQDYHTGSSR